jgi:hypothetical protein
MATHGKYQRVPGEDHDEPVTSYTQAPPSYQAESSSHALLGAARTEDDNLPDDFKVYTAYVPFILMVTNGSTVWRHGRRGYS